MQKPGDEQPGVEAPIVPHASPYTSLWLLVGGQGAEQQGLVVSTSDGLVPPWVAATAKPVLSTPWRSQLRANSQIIAQTHGKRHGKMNSHGKRHGKMHG